MTKLLRTLILTTLLLLAAMPLAAQTFYEVNYIDPDDEEEYTGLMIYYDEQHCKLRLINDELLNKDLVYESDYVYGVNGKESRHDIGVMFYAPTEEEGFPTFVWMWERDDASDISEQPYCTFDVEDEDSYFEVNHFTEISLRDMDQEYIEQFYGEEEPEYKMMMRALKRVNRPANNITLIRPGSPDAASNNSSTVHNDPHPGTSTLDMDDDYGNSNQNWGNQPATFHLIAVANTDVSDIGVACQRDLANIRYEFSGIAKALGMNYDERIVAAQQYNKANAVQAIRGTYANPNDVVMFVYSGHGFRFDNQSDYYPNIDLGATSYDNVQQNYVSMTDIYNELIQKGARLTIVLSDCCNTPIGMNAPMNHESSLFSRNNNNFDLARMQYLFLQSSGQIRATASSPGEVSWCNANGGYFLLSFIESLRTQISPLQESAPSWEALLNNAISSARSKSSANPRTKAQNGIKSVKLN